MMSFSWEGGRSERVSRVSGQREVRRMVAGRMRGAIWWRGVCGYAVYVCGAGKK